MDTRAQSPFSVACLTVVLIASALAVGACRAKSPLQQLPEARRLVSDLRIQFAAATDAANRAVMAEQDEPSASFARQAEQAKEAVQNDATAVSSILADLRYTDESRLLATFLARFAEYRALDQTILGLAVENTNVKAQRLAFGAAQDAADAFRQEVDSIAPLNAPSPNWRLAALGAAAVTAVRDIQVLQAPHIAEPEEAVMSRIEQRMTASVAAARRNLESLARLVPPADRPRLSRATAALERFLAVNDEILALSRRNTNVRSLALSLNQKGALSSACEESLRALSAALDARGRAGTR